MSQFCRALICACGLCVGIEFAHATENGNIAYPIGVNTVMAGAMPGPGETWLQNYSVYYTANAFSGIDGSSAVPGFDANVAVNASRFFHNWGLDLGPFQVASGVVIPFMNVDIGTIAGSSADFGVGDITLQPLLLGWSNADRTFFGYFGLDIYVPTGGAISSGYFSFDPIVNMTWLPMPRWELSTSIGMEFHAKNDATDYQSGSLFFMDWGVNYHPFDALPAFAAGFGGYVIKQFTDDRVNDVVFQDGFRQQGVAIGPQISYGTLAGAFAVKWQHEFATEARPDGERFWFQFLLPLFGK